MNAVTTGIALLSLSLSPGGYAQTLMRDTLALGAPMLDNAATTTVPSVIRPIVDSRTHRMRLGVKIARSYETRQVTDLEKAWGSAGPGTLAGTVTTSDSADMPGNANTAAGGALFNGLALGRFPGMSGDSGFAGMPGLAGMSGSYGAAGGMGAALPPNWGSVPLPSGGALVGTPQSSTAGDLH
ncbi:hypothetical protein QZM18_27975 [Burkholderia diffusa]|uniref:hypothetical protein n=1 Tax=Burkholderia diffusa TaxID=488732 RepID=UPI00264C955D|nr:hypothetical protein [Burkholderia diffusa]MDN7907927.1 hypothetical protein [Burkholderia diffusa]